MTTLPVTDLSTPPTADTIVFPHFADGGGWTTQIILVNASDSVLTGTVQFLNQTCLNRSMAASIQLREIQFPVAYTRLAS